MASQDAMHAHEAPLVISGLEVDGVSLRAVTPLRFDVTFNPVEALYAATGPFEISATGGSRAELEEEIAGALRLLWRDYAFFAPVGMSAEALALRQELLGTFAAL